jgi:hypothetical protein
MPQFDAALFKDRSQRGFLFIAGSKKGVPSYWRAGNAPGAAPIHLALAAPDRVVVDAFYLAALASGGRDNGPPGFRDQGNRKEANFVAFVLGPDNNNIEASWPIRWRVHDVRFQDLAICFRMTVFEARCCRTANDASQPFTALLDLIFDAAVRFDPIQSGAPFRESPPLGSNPIYIISTADV